MSHPDRMQLLEYLRNGDAAESEHEWIDEHITDCQLCQSQLDQLSAFAPDSDEGETLFDGAAAVPCFDGRYEVIGQIGRGGMADVFRCRDTTLDRDVAIKVIRTALSGDVDALHRFDRESRVCARLQHPGIVPVHDIGRISDGRPFIAMKHVEGDTLAKLMQHPDRWSHLSDRLNVFVRICETMAYVHQVGVIHRDLKPQNIKVGEFGEVQIMDWGIAKVLRGPTDPSTSTVTTECSDDQDKTTEAELDTGVIGTPGYMSPEQSRSSKRANDPRTDVFALGIILADMLLAEHQFEPSRSRDEDSHVRRVENLTVRLNENAVDAELVGLVLDCVSLDPKDRPSDAGSIAVRAKGHLSQQTERARQAELRAASAQTQAAADRRRRNQVMVLSGLLLTAVVSAAALFSRDIIQRNRKQVLQVATVDAFLGQRPDVSLVSAGSLDEALDLRSKTLDLSRQSVNGSLGEQFQQRIHLLDQFVSDRQDHLRSLAATDKFLSAIDDARATYRRHCGESNDLNRNASQNAMKEFDAAFSELDISEINASHIREILEGVPASRRSQVQAAADEWVLLTHLSGQQRRAARMREVLIQDGSTSDNVWSLYQQRKWRELHAFSMSSEGVRDPFLIRLCYELKREQAAHAPRAIAGLRKAWIKHPRDFHLNWELGRHWVATGEKATAQKQDAEHVLYSMWALTFFVRCNLAFNDHEGSVDQASKIMTRLGQPQAAKQMLQEWRILIAKADES